MKDKGTFVQHIPCDSCGSSDANALYDNNTTTCFACGAYSDLDGTEPESFTVVRGPKGVYPELEYKALAVRKIGADTCKQAGYGVCTYNGSPAQAAIYRSLDGHTLGMKFRTPDKQFRWSGESGNLFWGQHRYRSGNRSLVITEGEIDALSVMEVLHKIPVVSLPNGCQAAKKTIQANLDWLDQFETVILWFDSDEPGRQAVEDCISLLKPGRVKVVSGLPADCKDANDVLTKHGAKLLTSLVFDAPAHRPDGILSGSDIKVNDLYMAEAPKSVDLSVLSPLLSDKLRGLRKGELTLLTAGTGCGKSTFARELAYLLLMQGYRVGYMALEESKEKMVLGLMALHLGLPLGSLFMDRKQIPQELFDQAHKQVTPNLYLYDHFGSVASEQLLNRLRFLATGLECDFVVLDHISIAISGIDTQDERKAIDVMMTGIRSLIEQTKVGMLVISHLKQPEGKAHEEGRQVSINDLRGSGSLKQLSDNIISIERNQQSEDEGNHSLIRVLKNRLFGDLGKADLLVYSKDTGRLVPTEQGDGTELLQGEF